MSDTQDSDAVTIRRTIRQTIRDADDPPRRTALVELVSTRTGAPATAVRDELDACERHGFVYLVGDDDPEVKLP